MANVIEFTLKGVDKLSGVFGKVASTVGSVVKGIAKIGAAVLAAGTAISGFVTVIANGIDKVAKFSTRIGVAVDQLSAMQFVASQAGISAEQFNMATQRMTRRVAEATQGLGEAKGALKELGIDAKSFSQLGLEDQFALLGEKMESVQNPSDKLRLAFKLFDSEGTAVLQMLNNGSEAMQAMAKDASYLGLVISEQAAANAEQFTNSMGRATGAMKGLGRGIAGELMPVIAGLAERFANFIADSRDNIVSFVKSALVNFFVFIEVLGQVYERFKSIFSGNQEILSQYLDGLGRFVVKVGELFLLTGKMIAMGFWHGIILAKDILNGFGAWLGQAIYGWFNGGDIPDLSDTMAKTLTEGFAKAGAAIAADAKPVLDSIKGVFGEIGGAITDALGIDMEKAVDAANQKLSELSVFGVVPIKQAVGDVTETLEQMNTRISSSIAMRVEELSLLTTYAQSTSEAFLYTLETIYLNAQTMGESIAELTTNTFEQMTQGIGQSVAQAIVYGRSLSEAMKATMKSVLASIIQTLVQVGLQRLILSSIFGSANAKEAGMEGARAVQGVFANQMMSMSTAPFPLNLTAPAVAAGMAGLTAAGIPAWGATGRAAGTAGVAGLSHGGLGFVPSESTYLLDKGERVLSPGQNRDLTSFLEEGGSGGGVTIETVNVSVLPNATSADALLRMRPDEIEEVVAGPIINALNRLSRKGVKPLFAEQ